MIFIGPFQLKIFYDFTILNFQDFWSFLANRRNIEVSMSDGELKTRLN